MQEVQAREGDRSRFPAHSGPVSSFLGGPVPKRFGKGELPECQLLGFVDAVRRVGCLAHPLAETSGGYDGRDQEGFIHCTGCCRSIGCEASREFNALSPAALKVFARAVAGMSWYEYSRHATSVLVYSLCSYDHLLQRRDERALLDGLAPPQFVGFTNALIAAWPLRNPEPRSQAEPWQPGDGPRRMDPLDIFLTDIPLAERVMYLALDTWFFPGQFASQLPQAREYLESSLASLRKRG